jgi:alkylation response protein AidB-like acyl-CoA dehydrogenase
MSDYIAPLRDMHFVLNELGALQSSARLPPYADLTPELAESVLEEAAKLASGVLAPLNRAGDEHGARCENGIVTTTPGWKAAYQAFASGGWCGLSSDPEYGGQGLPHVISALVEEMWNGANMAFALCPMLARGATAAIESRASQSLRETYLRRMISGEWSGTMNLTEPQAGTDLAAVATRAVPQPDGTYRLSGQKIFITYGDHDLTENIIHLVLARTPQAPPGVRGLSLFVAPKFMVNADGSVGARNDVQCVSIEHKLGIHGSPTAVLSWGSHPAAGSSGPAGATAWLVGEENRGLEYMFIMMNAARFGVGVEGVGIAERAFQRARQYARERIQGTELGAKDTKRVPIIRHPDVRRMLLTMKAQIEAMRALSCTVAAALDAAHAEPEAAARARAQAFADLMIPVLKGCNTENAVSIASLGVQIHGGMGFIEETGAAQHLRDARITTIYEGTTGVQANDLIGRKVARDGGRAAADFMARVRAVLLEVQASPDQQLRALATPLQTALDALAEATIFVASTYAEDPRRASAGAVPYLQLFGLVAGGWQMARAAQVATRALAAGSAEAPFYRAKLATVRFYTDHLLAAAPGLASTVIHGAEAVLDYEEELV